MLLHLEQLVEVTLAGRSLGRRARPLHLLQVIHHFGLGDGQLAVGTLLHVLHAVVVMQLKRLLRDLFRARYKNPKVRMESGCSTFSWLIVERNSVYS